jgi:serine/threonine-protein kinase PpkA
MPDNVQVPGYKVIRKLGEGGMATVFLAVQESLDREVALKVMAPVLAANATFCEQFMKEGRITAKLTHPHLMTVHDIGSENGVYYLASEYLPAGTLRERMDRITTNEILDVTRDISAGLAYAHEKGFVHRDVKPGNIMFRANGTAVLADFGIAKAMKSVSAATMAGNAIGTPDYMSPEQAQATMIDGRSDLYSLGAVLFECLAGHKAYQANDAYAVALMHVTEPVPQLPEHVAWLQPLIEGLMAKNPDQRFATGEVYIAALDHLLMEHPQADATAQRAARKRNTLKSVTPLPGSVPAAKVAITPAVRRMSTGAMAGIAVGLLVVVIAVIWFVMRRNPATSSTDLTMTTTQPVNPPVVPSQPLQTQGENQATAAIMKLDMPTLLSRGDEYLAYGQKNFGEKLDFPPGENAIDVYREVLRRDSSNAQAKSGLAKIAAYYEQAARDALRNGLFTATDEFIDKGLRADPNNQTLVGLRAELVKKEQGG